MRDEPYQQWIAGLKAEDPVLVFVACRHELHECMVTSRRKGRIYTTGEYGRWNRWNFDEATGVWSEELDYRLIQPGSAAHAAIEGILQAHEALDAHLEDLEDRITKARGALDRNPLMTLEEVAVVEEAAKALEAVLPVRKPREDDL
jgi:hypothetical protein